MKIRSRQIEKRKVKRASMRKSLMMRLTSLRIPTISWSKRRRKRSSSKRMLWLLRKRARSLRDNLKVSKPSIERLWKRDLTTRPQETNIKTNWPQLPACLKIRKLLWRKRRKTLSKRQEKKSFWTRMWQLLRKRKESRLVRSWLLKMSLRSFKTRSRAIRQRPKNSKSWSISLRKTSKNMVSKLLRLTQNTINALSKLKLRTIWSRDSKRKILKLRVDSSSNRISMRL